MVQLHPLLIVTDLAEFVLAKDPGKPTSFIAERFEVDHISSIKWCGGEDHREK
jgi:hypothetical protein